MNHIINTFFKIIVLNFSFIYFDSEDKSNYKENQSLIQLISTSIILFLIQDFKTLMLQIIYIR